MSENTKLTSLISWLLIVGGLIATIGAANESLELISSPSDLGVASGFILLAAVIFFGILLVKHILEKVGILKESE